MRAALLASSALVAASALPAAALDATWLATPGTNDLNTGTNWSTGTVPDGIATFDQSSRTSLAISGFFNFVTINTLAFNAGAPAYTIDTGSNFLTLDGLGVVNSSSNALTINVTGGLTFDNSATAANTIINGDAGTTTSFAGSSTAANAVITMNGGLVQFTGTADGDNAQITVTDVFGSGKADFSGTTGVGSNNIVHAGSIAGSGSFSLGANQLIVGTNNLSTTVSGVIDGVGGSLTKVGTGTLSLTNANTYTGNTTVNAGTLSVNGDIRTSNRVIVNSGGTLGGTGFVPDTQIRAGATLAPGNSVGTLNVVGNLQLITGSTYAVEVSSAGADRTNVSGTATLGGAAVNASVAAGTTVNRQYTILNAASLTGRFNSTVTTNLPSSFVSSLSYDTNNVYLNFALSYSQGTFGGLDQNQQNVGNALTNYFNSNGGIPLTFGLTSGGLTQASGEPGASVPTAGFTAMYQFITAMMDNAGGNGGQGGPLGFAEENAYAPKRKLSPQQSDAYAAVTPRDHMAPTFAARWNVWATGYGGNSTISGNSMAGSHNASTRVYGTAVGADYRATPDTRFGFALGGAGTNFTVDSGLGGGGADVFQAGAYARHTIGAAYLTGALAYGWQDVTTDRTVTVSGTDKLHARMKTNALSARLEGGWRTAMLPVAVTPYGALQSTAFYLPSYAESAISGSNQYALSYASKTVTATRSELGTRFDKTMPLNAALLTLRGRAAWAHDWNTDRSATATFQSLPGATFTVNGAQPSANAALVSAGADLAWGNGWSVAANFDGEFSSNTRSYAGRGSLRRVW